MELNSIRGGSIESFLGELRNLIDEGLVLLGPDGSVLFANNSWKRLHGVGEEGTASLVYSDFLGAPGDKALFADMLGKVCSTGHKEYFVLESAVDRAGHHFPVDVFAKRIELEAGRNCVLLFERDISAKRDAEKLQLATYRIASAAVVSESLNELFVSIHKTIYELIEAKNIYIALFDPKKNLLEFPYFVDEVDAPPPPEPLGRNLTSYVLKTGKPLLVDPVKFEELVAKGEVVMEGAPSVDWLGVPLLSNNFPIGVIAVQSYTRGTRYGQKEVDLLNFVSGQIAMAIERRRTLEALKEGEERLRTLAEATSAGIMIFQDETVKYVNQSALKLVGYEENEVYNRRFWEFLRQDYQSWVRNRAEARLKGADVPSIYEVVAIGKNGQEVWLQLTVSLIKYEGAMGTLVTAFDISDRKSAEFSLKESEERFRTLAETTSAAIFMFKGQWIVYVNSAAEALTGYTRKELLSMQLWDIVHPDEFVESHQEFINQLKRGKELNFSQLRMLTKRGEERWASFKGGTTQLEGDAVLIVTAFDITQIVQAQENLKYLAHHDFLTGLENRWAFHENLLRSMEEAQERDRPLALLFMDLDRFKELNDTEGHIVGDKILRAAASRLSSIIEEGASLARIGSDEFTVILANSSPKAVEDTALRILSAFEEPFTFSGKEFHITLSIGICVFPEDGEDLESLLKNADIAMFRAKAEGGSTYQFYKQEMSTEAKEKIEMRNRLHGAIERNELALYFQPIYNGTEMVGMEALLRWFDPKFGMIPPDKFIPLAEETGLIVPLGEWVLNVACSHLKNLHTEGHRQLKVAVNLSARQFHRRDLLDVLEGVLQRVGLDPACLELEITERTAVMDLESTTAMLYALSRKGIRLAIDDFGAGYSSMTYLKRFPIHCLKIDMSFIKDIERDPKDLAIVRAIITMAHGLGLEVVAEGVETDGQLKILSEIGCDHFQGHYFGKAVPIHSLEITPRDRSVQ